MAGDYGTQGFQSHGKELMLKLGGCCVYPLKLKFLSVILQFDTKTSVMAPGINHDSQHHAHISLLQSLNQHIFA